MQLTSQFVFSAPCFVDSILKYCTFCCGRVCRNDLKNSRVLGQFFMNVKEYTPAPPPIGTSEIKWESCS